MILNRLGNKKVLIKNGLLKYFPKHELYIELFFGSGSVFWQKPLANYNILNDLDSDVYNLFTVITERKQELYDYLELMPIHIDLWNYWKKNYETDPVRKAVRFLFLSNFGYMGKPVSLMLDKLNTKQIILDNIKPTFEKLKFAQFHNSDFRTVLKLLKNRIIDRNTFCYCDPPYLGTENNYAKDCQFKESDAKELFETLLSYDINFAISEFDHPYILQLATENKLNINYLGERQNMKNRRTEILVTNYSIQKTLF